MAVDIKLIQITLSIYRDVGVLCAWPMRWVNNPLWHLKRCKHRSSWKYNFTAFQSNMTSLLWEVVKWEIQDVFAQRPACHRLNTESWMDCRVQVMWFSVVCLFVSVPALSIYSNHIMAFLTHHTSTWSGFPSSVRYPASGLNSWPSVKIQESQKSVRITCLYWLRNAWPTIHPDLWAQSLKTKRKRLKRFKNLLDCEDVMVITP